MKNIRQDLHEAIARAQVIQAEQINKVMMDFADRVQGAVDIHDKESDRRLEVFHHGGPPEPKEPPTMPQRDTSELGQAAVANAFVPDDPSGG